MMLGVFLTNTAINHLKKWPEDTSMRRAFKNHVLSGGKTGHGHGIIVFDGEKIVR